MILLSTGYYWVDIAKGSDGVWRWGGGFEHLSNNYKLVGPDHSQYVLGWAHQLKIFREKDKARAYRFCQAPVT